MKDVVYSIILTLILIGVFAVAAQLKYMNKTLKEPKHIVVHVPSKNYNNGQQPTPVSGSARAPMLSRACTPESVIGLSGQAKDNTGLDSRVLQF